MTVKLSCNSNTVLIINQLLQSMEIRPLPRTHISSITLTSRRKNISEKNFCDLMSGLSGWKILYNLNINTRSNTMFCYHSISYKPNLFLLKAVVIRWLTHAIISIHFLLDSNFSWYIRGVKIARVLWNFLLLFICTSWLLLFLMETTCNISANLL